MRHVRGNADGHEGTRSIPAALAKFKAAPTGPDARDSLIIIARAVEGIADPTERAQSARMLATELATTINETGPTQKPEVVATIGYGISESPLLTLMLKDETGKGEGKRTQEQPRTPGKERPRDGRPRRVVGDMLEAYCTLLGVDPVALGLGGFGIAHPISAAQRCITPDDPQVLRAVREAIRVKGSLTIGQICDVYDYVVRKVEYLNTSHPTEPRAAAVTLEARIGDCKCMSVVLASMLEAIGAKTILIDAKSSGSRYGHEFLGVMVSDDQDDWRRNMHQRAVTGELQRRYQIFISLIHRNNKELSFVELVVGGRKQLYLLLDPTLGQQGVPGKIGNFDQIGYYESRPGTSGIMPSL